MTIEASPGERERRLHVLELLGNAIVGGMETFVTRLVGALPQDAFRVTALCPFEGHVSDALRDAGADVVIAPVRDDPAWLTVQLATAIVHDEAVDVLHAHLANAHVLGALVSALTERPCLATIHGRTVPMLDFEAHRLTDAMHVSVVCRAAYSHARAIGVARDRLHLIPNGVPAPDASADSTALATSLGLAADVPLVGYVGRLSPEKGPELFVRMAWQLAAKHPRAAFVIIGDGPMRERLREDVRVLGIGDRVHFAGERRDVLALLPSLTVVVVPSRTEGMPLALMEAMAAGLPVVATSVGGIPELIQHLQTGLLVGAGDPGQLAVAVDGLLDDLPWAAAIGARARQRAVALWPQRESALRMGALLRRIAHSAEEGARARPATPARVRLAGAPGSR